MVLAIAATTASGTDLHPCDVWCGERGGGHKHKWKPCVQICGVPIAHVHLCALHATVRLTEYLIRKVVVIVWNRLRGEEQLPTGPAGFIHHALSSSLAKATNRLDMRVTMERKKRGARSEGESDDEGDDDGLSDHKAVIYSLTGQQAAHFWGLQQGAEGEYSVLPRAQRPYNSVFMKQVKEVAQSNVSQTYAKAAEQAGDLLNRFAEDMLPILLGRSFPPATNLDHLQEKVTAWYDDIIDEFDVKGISTYLHMLRVHVVAHIRRDGNIVDWAQQGLEAAHKNVKQAMSKGTQFGGGKGKGKHKLKPGQEGYAAPVQEEDEDFLGKKSVSRSRWLAQATQHLWAITHIGQRHMLARVGKLILPTVTQRAAITLLVAQATRVHALHKWGESDVFYARQSAEIMKSLPHCFE